MSGIPLFTLAGVPVRVSPWYFLLLVFFARGELRSGMLWAACITISLLAHEFGHALVARHYRLQPQILLHGFGGLTGHRPAANDRQNALIVAAGPLSGLALALLSLVGLFALTPPQLHSVDGVMLLLSGRVEGSAILGILTRLSWINLFWSIFNALPIWPMDGGQLLRIFASHLLKPARGERLTHIVSLAMVVVVAIAASSLGFGYLMLIILALTAWQNVQALSHARSQQGGSHDNPYARELLAKAQEAYQNGDDDEAARLCHQLRAESHVPEKVLARAWGILGVTSTRKGEYEEALSYLKRAPDMPDVVEATAQCFYQLDMQDALQALVTTRAFSRLPSDTREAILRALSEMAVSA